MIWTNIECDDNYLLAGVFSRLDIDVSFSITFSWFRTYHLLTSFQLLMFKLIPIYTDWVEMIFLLFETIFVHSLLFIQFIWIIRSNRILCRICTAHYKYFDIKNWLTARTCDYDTAKLRYTKNCDWYLYFFCFGFCCFLNMNLFREIAVDCIKGCRRHWSTIRTTSFRKWGLTIYICHFCINRATFGWSCTRLLCTYTSQWYRW